MLLANLKPSQLYQSTEKRLGEKTANGNGDGWAFTSGDCAYRLGCGLGRRLTPRWRPPAFAGPPNYLVFKANFLSRFLPQDTGELCRPWALLRLPEWRPRADP